MSTLTHILEPFTENSQVSLQRLFSQWLKHVVITEVKSETQPCLRIKPYAVAVFFI